MGNGCRTPLAGAVLLAAIVGAACGGDGQESVPAAVEQTPDLPAADIQAAAGGSAPAPSPDSAVQDVDAARRLIEQADALEHDGFWEAAAEARGRATESELGLALPAGERQRAQLAQARLLLRLGRAGDALVLIESLDRSGFEPSNGRTLDLLTARAAEAVDERPTAIDALSRYLAADGAAAVTALLMRARLLTNAHQVEEAEADLRAAIDHATALDDQIASARVGLGALLEWQARYEEAAEQYLALLTASPSWYEAIALHRLGAIAWTLGDPLGAEQWWIPLMQDHPYHWRSSDALFQLTTGDWAVNPVLRGLVLYRHARYEEAAEVLSAFLETDPPAAERHGAAYYLAAIAEDQGRSREAIAGYLSAVEADEDGDLADDALWWAARLSEELGELAAAIQLYDRLVAGYAGSPFAADARFLAGLASFTNGDITAAQDRFALLRWEDQAADAQRGLLWSGKSLALLGEPERAAAAYARAVTLDPYSYYGLRAATLLADRTDRAADRAREAPAGAPFSPDVPQLRAGGGVVAWLAAAPGPVSPDRGTAVVNSRDWRAAQELHGAGLRAEADARFRNLIDSYRAQPWALHMLGRRLEALRLPHLRIEAAEALLAPLEGHERTGAPPEILAWAYPAGWRSLAVHEAEVNAFDELLLYAMIRQESRFNPDAGSPAGALGLTQVIEPTGVWIAERLGDGAFHTADLFRPHLSIRYGAFYLDVQIETFEHALPLALAAYNAGPGNAIRWSGDDPGIDPDLFYERVSFAETRLYLETVLENYAWYRFLYANAPAPSLTGG